MRRSFGGGNRGMGGGSGGGGGGGGGLQMLRTVQRAVRAGTGGAAQEPFPHTNSNTTTTNTANSSRRARQSSYNKQPSTATNKLCLSSSTLSPFAPLNFPISAVSTAPTWPSCSSPTYTTDESEWECIDGSDDDSAHALLDDFVFGSVPSVDEVHHAVYSLQEFIEPVSSPYFMKDRLARNLDKDTADKGSSPTGFLHQTSSYGDKLDWIEPSLRLCSSSSLQPYGSEGVYDAFHLLQNEPSVQRMVISLSSDRAVWDAVLNNEIVREIRDSFNQDDNSSSEGSVEIFDTADAAGDILSWIVTIMKAKIMELIRNITKSVNELFYHKKSEKEAEQNADPLEEKLRASFMLSIVVLLIVVLNRANKA